MGLCWAYTVNPLILRRPGHPEGKSKLSNLNHLSKSSFVVHLFSMIISDTWLFSDILDKLSLFLEHIYRGPIRSPSIDSYRSDLQCMVIFKKQFGMAMCCFKVCSCLLLLWHLRIIPKESILLIHW